DGRRVGVQPDATDERDVGPGRGAARTGDAGGCAAARVAARVGCASPDQATQRHADRDLPVARSGNGRRYRPRAAGTAAVASRRRADLVAPAAALVPARGCGAVDLRPGRHGLGELLAPVPGT